MAKADAGHLLHAQQLESPHSSKAKIATRTARRIIGAPVARLPKVNSRAVSRVRPAFRELDQPSRGRSPCGRALILSLGYAAAIGTSTGGDGYLIIKIAIDAEHRAGRC
jgi:hypothetical protein